MSGAAGAFIGARGPGFVRPIQQGLAEHGGSFSFGLVLLERLVPQAVGSPCAGGVLGADSHALGASDAIEKDRLDGVARADVSVQLACAGPRIRRHFLQAEGSIRRSCRA